MLSSSWSYFSRWMETVMIKALVTDGPSGHLSEDRQLIRHIAVCLDRSAVGDRVMPHAVAISRAFGAKLTVLHALEPPHDGPRATLTDPLDWEVQRTEAQRHLEALRLKSTTVDLSSGTEVPSIGSEVLEGRPAEVIRDWVASHGVDLTVLASHGASGPTEWTLASTARKLVEGISGSVLLIPARSVQEPLDPEVSYDRVLTLLDGSTRAECALAVASQVAQSEGSELHVLHVVRRPESPCPCPLDDEEHDLDQRLVDRNVRAAKSYLHGVSRRLAGDGVRVRTHVSVEGSVGVEIQRRIAEDHIDLVVLSGHGHGGRAQLPLGAVAAFLLEHATVPLLVVRDRSAPLASVRPELRIQSGVRLPQVTEA